MNVLVSVTEKYKSSDKDTLTFIIKLHELSYETNTHSILQSLVLYQASTH